MHRVAMLLLAGSAAARVCERARMPLERGEWQHDMKHLDSAVVENRAVSINEGQIYVYEKYFPGYTIKYIHVDNVAMKSCGASASVSSGGVGDSGVLIVLHAGQNQEIRSVVDIWGEKNFDENPITLKPPENKKTSYLFKKLRAVNHNSGF